jgi:hypothetical protein
VSDSEQAQAAPAKPAPEQPSSAQSEIVGKKVYFLYPSAPLQLQVITELVQREYEVYSSKDHVRMAHVLKKYSDSILFINIDEGISEPEWEKWVGGITSALPNVKIGIFSSTPTDELKTKFENTLHAECGYMALKLDMKNSAPKVIEVLDKFNAKGRRKYLRATMDKDSNATINMPVNTGFANGTIKDISVVGISCSFEHDPGFRKNELFKNIQVRLQTMLLKVEAVVFGSRMEGEEKVYVFIFTQRIDPDVRTKIRTYIQSSLQRRMDDDPL